jgi:hypothetical protein
VREVWCVHGDDRNLVPLDVDAGEYREAVGALAGEASEWDDPYLA